MTAKQDPNESKTLLNQKGIAKNRRTQALRYWEALETIAQSIPEAELENVPQDASVHYRHYLYGHPKAVE